uniref:Peptidyl-prolyl cis-trans isomerase n=1 Tax=Periplaneta americana TaxID=6978 RepID=A0A2P0XJ00_PERAM|nr:putative Per a allergen [Periplaneta americana]
MHNNMENNQNPLVFLDINIGLSRVGRVVLELYKDVCPKTTENFRALCTGEKGVGKLGKPLHYKGSIFHKAVSEFMIQGGDIISFDGTGGESIYGLTFEDENFEIKHHSGGLLSMANAGPNSNSSQFFITTVPCTHLDDVNVVFGEVKKGFGIVEEVSRVTTDQDRPLVVTVHLGTRGRI